MMTFRSLLGPFRRLDRGETLSEAAPRERQHDRRKEPGPERCVAAALHGLARAQDRSTTADSDVARHFGLLTGWSPSYPETTGSVVSTFLHTARL